MPTHPDNRSLIRFDGDRLEKALRDHVERGDFPCMGAKSANARGLLHIVPAWSMTSGWDDLRIHDGLLEWSYAYARKPEGLRSFAVVFSGPVDLTEAQFEKALWERLQSLADKDEWRGQPYDRRVSSDPDNALFSLSFGQQGYFVVGMHPKASRKARRTPYPTLVFNLHDQFERLRDEDRYERMREKILQRDEAFSGSINPMLSRHGDNSEARQYSGRAVDDDWRCPFHGRRSHTDVRAAADILEQIPSA